MQSHKANCPRESLTIKYEGPVMLTICTNPKCAVLMAYCEHQVLVLSRKPDDPYTQPTTKWNEDGTVLSCTYCGKDVT